MINAFEHDRATARGEKNPRKLVIFKHGSHLGNELFGSLFERVKVYKNTELPRRIGDYKIDIDKNDLLTGINVKNWQEEPVC